MSDFGLTEKGFKRKRQIDILESLQSNAKGVFGSDVNVNVNSPLGMILMIVSFEMGIAWQEAENVYYSAYKDTAEGYQLDNVGQYISISRKAAGYAKGIATLTGVPGTLIPDSFVIACNNVQFWTLQQATIGGTGVIDVNIQAIDVGVSGNVAAGTITTIVNSMAGVTSVTNALDTYGGSAVEAPTAFRTRYDKSIAMGGSSTPPSIQAALINLDNVIDADVTENDTVATVNGIPPKCVSCFVYGGADAEIAKTILETKSGGIQAFGTTVIPVTDSNGEIHQVGFTRATEVPVYVRVTLTKDASIYPIDGDAVIQTAIVSYIGGADADGAVYPGLGLEKDVIFTKIIGLCHKVSGVTDVVVTLSTDNTTFTEANINIGTYSVAITDYVKVVIS